LHASLVAPGVTKFYWRFIQAFSDVVQPLFDLTKKGVA
jgi:hypothetical protein